MKDSSPFKVLVRSSGAVARRSATTIHGAGPFQPLQDPRVLRQPVLGLLGGGFPDVPGLGFAGAVWV